MKRGAGAARVAVVCASLLLVGAVGPAMADSILSSKHNLSASGPGTLKAQSEARVCIFCHTTHNAAPQGPLWNRADTGRTYTPYESSTMEGAVGQPTGSSKLCLSCHDGTIALGAVRSRGKPIAMAGGKTVMPPGRSRLGLDLGDDHPISFAYDPLLAAQDGQLKHPGNFNKGAIKLDRESNLQCRSCHDPHDNQFGQFLVMENTQSALCVACHARSGWDFSSHKLSTARWSGTGLDPWPTTDEGSVEDNACANCHQSHSAPGRKFLMHAAKEEDNCFACHNGNVAAVDMRPEFRKLSAHAVDLTQGVHEPNEDPASMTMHVECADCHEPHSVRDAPKSAPDVPGAVGLARGVSAGGQKLQRVSYGYEVCFKCHADHTDRAGARVPRQVRETNVRREFGPGAVSSHPVASPSPNANVPSLRAAYTPGSLIACTDCHGSESSKNAGGLGPNGPHGSMYEPLLERRLDRPLGRVGESPDMYALCYKCHDRNSLLSDESFGEHQSHINMTGCLTCHDPHGIPSGPGNPVNNGRLMNFAIDIVQPGPGGRREWMGTGRYRGSCTLTCHSETHVDESYVGRLAGG